MNDLFRGRVAIVTGASRGIGRDIACRLADEGALVAVHYVSNKEAAEETVSLIKDGGGESFMLQANLCAKNEIDALYDRLDAELKERSGSSRVDFLINNAGGGGGGSTVEATTEEQYDAALDLNTKGVFFMCQHAIPRMVEGGRIINLSSMASLRVTAAGVPYMVAKAALNAMTRYLASELGPKGITANAICPGPVKTDLLQRLLENIEGFEEHLIDMTAVPRLGEVKDISDFVMLLLQPGSSWVTGQIIETSGGHML